MFDGKTKKKLVELGVLGFGPDMTENLFFNALIIQ